MSANSATTATTAFTTKLRKFDGTGYRVWARQLQLYLEVKDVWGAVLKPTPNSLQLEAEEAGQAAQSSTQKERPLHQLVLQQKLAMTIILSAMTEEQAALVADLPHPQDMLTALQKNYRHVCDSTVGALKREYLALYIDAGGDMLEHIRQTRLMLAELESFKVRLTDAEKISNFLQSLGPDWNGYIGSLEVCTTIEELLVKAAAEARRRKTQGQRGRQGASQTMRSGNAFYAEKGKKGTKKGKCFNCGKLGHFQNECKAKEKAGTGFKRHGAGHDNNGGAESGFVFAMGSAPEAVGADWIIDSGASSHMTGSRELLEGVEQLDSEVTVTTANGVKLGATHAGKARLPLVTGGACTLEHVLYVPGLKRNLVSLSKVGVAGLKATFDQDRCVIKNGAATLVATRRSSGLYVVSTETTTSSGSGDQANAMSGDEASDLSRWHARLGHLNVRDLRRLLKDGGVTTHSTELPTCAACAAGKLATLPYPRESVRVLKRDQAMITIDYVGPMEIPSRDAYTGMVSMMVEPYHLAAVFPVKDKSSATQLRAIRECIANLKVAAPRARVAVLKSDNAAEYTSGAIAEFCNEQMIAQEFSTPYSPQQNGKVERSNRVVVEMARTMLQAAGMEKRFWSDAVLAAAYIRNRCPSKVLGGKTPLEALTGRAPDLSKLKTFGCDAEVLLPKVQHQKLDAKTAKGVFIGYEQSGGYRFWVPSGRGGWGRVVNSRTAVFFESKTAKSKMVSLDGELPAEQTQSDPVRAIVPYMESIQEDVEMEPSEGSASARGTEAIVPAVDPRAEKQPVRRSTRAKKKSVRRLEFEEAHNAEEVALITELDDPLTLQEAMSRPDAEQWRQAINAELESLRQNGTYAEVFRPRNVRPVQTKWVFRRKTLVDGTLDKYKARLVAKGFSQQYGVDYTETFSPVVRHDSIRAILALAVQLGWDHLQLDVQSAFLNSDLSEDIYVEPPTDAEGDKVWKLLKALYGLKQASRAWYETVTKVLRADGFVQCQSDTCVLVKNKADTILVVLLYVDDMLIFSNVTSELVKFKANITRRFAINECDDSSSFVGMELQWSKAGAVLTIAQQKYTAAVVKRFGSSGDRTQPRTPMDSTFQKQVADDEDALDESIRPEVGSLLYAATVSRPDIATAVRLVAQETEQPTRTVQTAIRRVIGYLKRTSSMGLQYQQTKGKLQLEVYCDAAFACEKERKSSTGFVVFLNGCCIAWGSKKQPIVTLSTTESEYVALAQGIKECIGLKQLLFELGYNVGPVIVHEDNQAAQHVAEGKGVARRSRHIDLRYHWVREQVQRRVIEIRYCRTGVMVADLFTKPLSQGKFSEFVTRLGMCRVGVSERASD